MDVNNNLAAMNAFAQGMQISAHNVANVSTDNYSSQAFTYGAGSASQVEVQMKNSAYAQNYAAPDQVSAQMANANAPVSAQSSLQDTPPAIINNTVELSREFTQQISTQNAFEANAAVIRTQDQMMSTLNEQVNGPAIVSYMA